MLQNAKVTVFTVSELLRENQQGVKQNDNFKHKIKRQQIPQKLVYEKFYVHEKFTYTKLTP